MWCYVKTLQFPVNLKCSDLNMAKLLITQFGGPDGELSAALRYLSQRFSMPTNKSKGMLNDIGTEEMAHVEIISTMVYQIMENATIDEIKKAGLAGHYADHGKGVYPTDATGNPWTATFFQSKGDVIADFFCGSGTSMVVAKELGRQYIGCDINPRAVEITNKRLNN